MCVEALEWRLLIMDKYVQVADTRSTPPLDAARERPLADLHYKTNSVSPAKCVHRPLRAVVGTN